MKRRTVLKGIAAVAATPLLASCSSSNSSSSAKTYSLDFDASSPTTLTKTVTIGNTSVTVKYRFYANNVYVTNPVNYKYQSLNVSVPIEIDGKTINTTNAPIVFAINVGGYTSSSVWGATAQGGGSGGAGYGGGFGGGSSAGAPGGGGSGAPSGASGAKPSGAPSGSGSGGPGGSSGSAGGPGTAAGASSVGLGSSMGSSWTSYDNGEIGLANGYIVVEPGCRGRDLETSAGKYYGKAPAAIVDLKAALRYVRHNTGIPGNKDWIITTGGSAGGALSALVGASGNSSLYDADLTALGAADADDNVFLTACYSPITDLDHADGQYEWMWSTLTYSAQGSPGASPTTSSSGSSSSTTLDKTAQSQLQDIFATYQQSLALNGINNYGTLTADNYSDYLMKQYLIPSATTALTTVLTSAERTAYLEKNTWITWADNEASFTWSDFLDHVGTRIKGVPAFDGFDTQNAENIEFGDETTNARHFTLYSLRHQTGNSSAQLPSDLPTKINMMNPMYHLVNKNSGRAKHWWLRTGSLDTNTAHTVVGNLAAATTQLGDAVNSSLYWDGGHAVNFDAPDLFTWIGKLTGYSAS